MRLFNLVSKRPVDEATLEEARKLQWKVSTAEEFIGKNFILGIREGIYRVLGMGHLEGGRLPLRGNLPEGEWERWDYITSQMAEVENSL
jgi:2-keto-3-deoxy-L-rhamnonate aldolase